MMSTATAPPFPARATPEAGAARPAVTSAADRAGIRGLPEYSKP